MALANVNDTNLSAVGNLYTSFRSVLTQENTSLHSVVQPRLLSRIDAVSDRKSFPFLVIYGFIMADSPVVVRLSPSGNPFCL